MRYPVADVPGVQETSGFYEVRGDHIHGAQDIIGPPRTKMFALRKGRGMWHRIEIRSKDIMMYNAHGRILWLDGKPYPFANYRLSIYGVCFVLLCEDPREVYVYAHMEPDFMRPFFSARQTAALWHKKSNEEYIDALWTDLSDVQEGDVVGYMGNAGFTTTSRDGSGADPGGTHLHIEGHHGWQWQRHADRVPPERFLRR